MCNLLTNNLIFEIQASIVITFLNRIIYNDSNSLYCKLCFKVDKSIFTYLSADSFSLIAINFIIALISHCTKHITMKVIKKENQNIQQNWNHNSSQNDKLQFN